MTVKKRAPARKRIQKVDQQDASAPTGAFAAPIPDEAVMPRSGAELGFTRREGISFRMADLMDEFAARTTPALPPSLVVRRDLKRFYAAMAWERDALAETELRFGAEDWAKLREALAGATFDSPKQVRMMWAYAAEHFGDESPFTAMLRTASLARCYAILDALESLAPEIEDDDQPAEVPVPGSAPMMVAEPAATYAGATHGA